VLAPLPLPLIVRIGCGGSWAFSSAVAEIDNSATGKTWKLPRSRFHILSFLSARDDLGLLQNQAAGDIAGVIHASSL